MSAFQLLILEMRNFKLAIGYFQRKEKLKIEKESTIKMMFNINMSYIWVDDESL